MSEIKFCAMLYSEICGSVLLYLRT